MSSATPDPPDAGRSSAVETRSIKRLVEEQFSQVADNYRTSSVHAGGDDLVQMLTAAALSGQEVILDAGSGAGHTALAFAPQAARVVSVDLSAAMLEQGRRLAAERGIGNVEFRQADVERLPLPDATFDLITSRYSAHHWPHPAAALAEFGRLLRPGGRLLLADIVSFADCTLDTYLQALEVVRDPSHVRDHRIDEWLAYLAAAGLPGTVVFRWDLRLDFAAWVQRMATPPASVAVLRQLLAGAPAEVRAGLRVEPDCSFTLPGALFLAQRNPARGAAAPLESR